MDLPEFYAGKPSPRRELQGPRPTPLKIRKDSHKIKKPPPGPPPQQSHQPPPQNRPPVIIYTVSPKVIHTNASEFMTLVQRLTGSSSSSSTSAAGALSPAARFATIEKTQGLEAERLTTGDLDIVDKLEIPANFDRGGSFPGILSPMPSSLPRISPNFFSPSVEPNSLSNFLHDLSPNFHGNRNYIEGTFVPSPSSFFSPAMTSPLFDLFNQFID